MALLLLGQELGDTRISAEAGKLRVNGLTSLTVMPLRPLHFPGTLSSSRTQVPPVPGDHQLLSPSQSEANPVSSDLLKGQEELLSLSHFSFCKALQFCSSPVPLVHKICLTWLLSWLNHLQDTCKSYCHGEGLIVDEMLKCELTLVINNGQSRVWCWKQRISIFCAPTMCQDLVSYFHVILLNHLSNTTK